MIEPNCLSVKNFRPKGLTEDSRSFIMPKSAEFILQPGLTSVVLVEPFGPGFAAVLEKLVEDPTLQIVECVSAMDALSVVRQMSSCVILVHAATPADVNQHVTLLKTLGTQILQRKSVRLVVTAASTLSTDQIEKLTQNGCTEIIPDSAAAKGVLFKLDRHLKALPRPGEAVEGDVTWIAGSMGRSDGAGTEEPGYSEPMAGVRLAPVLELSQDCWCLSGGGARLLGEEWRVRVRGPAPDHGRWVKSKKSGIWQWQVTAEGSDAGASGVGSGWFFGGDQKPEYSRGFWTFISRDPWLGYLESEGGVAEISAIRHFKFRLSERGSLLIARDSDAALKWLANARSKTALKVTRHEVQVALDRPTEPQAPSAVASGDGRVVYVEPLKLLSDFWVIEKNHPKRFAERWLIRIAGPGPAVGRWMPRRSRKTAILN